MILRNCAVSKRYVFGKRKGEAMERDMERNLEKEMDENLLRRVVLHQFQQSVRVHHISDPVRLPASVRHTTI